jgi:hypothetical protein
VLQRGPPWPADRLLVGVAFSWWAAAGLLSVCLLSRRIVRRAFFAFLWAWVDPEQLRGQRRFDYTLMLGIGPAGAKESRVFGLAGGWSTGSCATGSSACRGPSRPATACSGLSAAAMGCC